MELKLGKNFRLTGMDMFLIIVFIVWVFITYQIFWADTGDEKSKSNANHSGKTEIVFWHAMGGPLGEAMDKLIDKYNKDPNSKCYVKKKQYLCRRYEKFTNSDALSADS